MEVAVGREAGEERREEQVRGVREGSLRQVKGERDVTRQVMWEQQQMRKEAQSAFGLGGEQRRRTRACLWSAERAFTCRRDFSRISLFGFFNDQEEVVRD